MAAEIIRWLVLVVFVNWRLMRRFDLHLRLSDKVQRINQVLFDLLIKIRHLSFLLHSCLSQWLIVVYLLAVLLLLFNWTVHLTHLLLLAVSRLHRRLHLINQLLPRLLTFHHLHLLTLLVKFIIWRLLFKHKRRRWVSHDLRFKHWQWHVHHVRMHLGSGMRW